MLTFRVNVGRGSLKSVLQEILKIIAKEHRESIYLGYIGSRITLKGECTDIESCTQ